MGKKKLFRFVLTGNGWDVHDPSGAVIARLQLPSDPVKVRELALYGLKQVAADGAATDKEATSAERIAALRARHEAVHTGGWALRTGAGSVPRVPMPAVLDAAIAAGVLRGDRAAIVEAWTRASDAARARIAAHPAVVAAIAAAASPADDALASFTGDA